MPEHFLPDLLALLAFCVVGGLGVAVVVVLVDLVTWKIDFQTETRKGNWPAAAGLTAIILGACYFVSVVAKALLSAS